MLLTKEEIQFNLCSGDLLDDAFMKVAKAQLKKVVDELRPILTNGSTTMGRKVIQVVDLVAEMQSLLEEVK